jgi:DNA repair protein RadC
MRSKKEKTQKSFTLNDLPASERPRERLKKFGIEALSTQELLALILKTGVSGESVMVTASRLMSKFGTIKGISEASLEELADIKGIGPAKASQIKASFELARRKDDCTDEKITIKSSADVVKAVKPRLKDKKKEHFLVLSLDSRNHIININDISIGTLNASLVHPREVFKEAIQSLAASVILVHNHPSGEAGPSDGDLQITKRLVEAGKIMSIEVLDHIIIAGDNSFSFKGKGLIQ